MDSAPKKLDAVDKWRARVLFRDPPPPTDSWAKRMERQMAVLRVSFPFLTEKQLRGKAWTACGLRSLMGELPRSGLSPKVKKEFMKRGKDDSSNMSPKPKIKKEPITSNKQGSELSTNFYKLDNFGAEIIPSNKIILNSPCHALTPANFLPINEANILMNSSETLKKSRRKRKLEPKKVDFDTQENSSLISEVSWKGGKKMKVTSEDPYCSQISKENTVIIQSLVKYTPDSVGECSTATQPELNTGTISQHPHCSQFIKNDTAIIQSIDRYTPDTIGEYLTVTQTEPSTNFSDYHANELKNKSNELFNKDSGSSFFECNLPSTPPNHWSNPLLSIPFMSTNIEDSINIFKDSVDLCQTDKKSENQQVMKNSSAPCMKRKADSLSEYSNCHSSSTRISVSFSSSSELLTEESPSFNTLNFSQNEETIPFIFTQNYSLPSTPCEPLVHQPLLSDLCCEYSKACRKQEYKPLTHVNSCSIVRKLKEDFDKIIPPEVSLTKYFEAEEKMFDQIQSEVHDKVNNIILFLETDESIETNVVDN